jgi:hypothetical protein
MSTPTARNAAGREIRRLTHFNSFLFPRIAAIRLVRRAVPHARSHESDFTFQAPGPLNALLASIFGFEIRNRAAG